MRPAARRVNTIALLLIFILVTPILAWAQGEPTGATLVSVPIGTTNETNPEIFVVAPGKLSYRFSLNGAPYSPELPITAPIKLSGELELGGLRFTAGTSALIEFLKLKSTETAFTDFVDRVTYDELHSPLQVTYTINKMRAAVGPENVLNLRGAGVSALDVTLQEKTAIVPRFELRALAISGGHLWSRPSAGGARQFTLVLPGTTGQVTLTPQVDNGETQIFVNGQPSPSGHAITVPVSQQGQSILLQTVGPDNNVASYVIEVQHDDSLEPTGYRSYYLRTFTPASAYVSIRNTGPAVIAYQLAFNQKFGLTTQEIVRTIQDMEPEFPDEPIQRKVWRFIRDNRYHFDPLTIAQWNHSPGLFFNSIGFGYCDDSASLFRHLMTAMGFTSRVWALNGHVVPEVLINNRWEMWDPDLQVTYVNHSGLVAGVEELATDPDLIAHPLVAVPGAAPAAYYQTTADIYSSRPDNSVFDWYNGVPAVGDSSMTFEIPPGGTFEFPDLYDRPLAAVYGSRVPSYANARLIVPAGFSGTLTLPLVIQSIGWSNNPTLRVLTKDAAGNWDTQPTVASWVVDAERPFTVATQPSGTYNWQEPVTLTTSEPATIYYTTDGSTPSEASLTYAAPIALSPGAIVKFFAVDQLGNKENLRTYAPPVQQVQLQLVGATSGAAVFAGTASGASGSYEYMFQLRDPSGNWSIARYYQAQNAWSFDKSSAPPGSYLVVVCTRNLGSTGGCERSAEISFVVQPAAAPILVNPGDQMDSVNVRSYKAAILADSPIAYWRLDEEGGSVAADSAGTNPGGRFGSVAHTQPGALGSATSATQFDGATSYVQVPNSATLALAGDLTLELWVNASLATRQTLLSKDYRRELELTLETNGVLNLYHGNGVTYGNVRSATAAVSPNVWQHVVVTRSTATRTVRFYVNGQPKGSASYSVDPVVGPKALSIGRSESGTQHVNGRLAEVALYPSALSAMQIGRHYTMRLASGTGRPVELPLVASDANGDVLTYAATNLPPGLTIDPATGLISGSLTKTSAGIFHVVATASDGVLSQSQAFEWTVTHVNEPPALVAPAAQMHVENAPVAFQVSASDPDDDALTFGASGLPPSLTIDPATGIIFGTLPFGSAGSYSVTVTASDGESSSAGAFAWIVAHPNRAPTLANPGAQANYTRWGYPMAVMADGALAYWRLGEMSGTAAVDTIGGRHGNLLGGVVLGQPGALADGTAAMLFNGSSSYIQVPGSTTLPLAGDLTLELWINVSMATRQTLISKDYLREFELTVETSGLLNFYHGDGVTYGSVRSVTGAVSPNVWQHVVVTRSTATRTIAFYVNGVAKGAGTYTILPASGSTPLSIGRAKSGTQWPNGKLDEVAIYPVVLTPSQQAAHYQLSSVSSEPGFVALPLSAADPDHDVLTYSAMGLPAGLSIDGATGLISGHLTLASAGVHHVTATATDGALSHSQTFTWTVTEVNHAPIVASLAHQTSAEGAHISLPLSAIDPDGDPLSYSASGLPPSLTIDAATGLIQGTLSYTSAGAHTVVVTVTDGRLSRAQTFVWTVANTDRGPVLVNPGPQTSRLISAYPRAIVGDGSLAYWRLDETSGTTAVDSIGGRHGNLLGGVVLGQPGALADGTAAMLFNGSSSYIQVPGSTTLPLAGDLTLELWINVSMATRQTLISKDYLREFELTVETSGLLNFYHGDGVTYGSVRSVTGAVSPNVWQHVVVTRSTATRTIAFYVNGVAKGAGTYTILPASGSTPLSIGRAKSGTQWPNGKLDEVAIYPVVFSLAQAGAHYALRTSPGSDEITLQFSATDPDGDPVSFAAVGLPPGLVMSGSTGLVSGTLTGGNTGTYHVTVTASGGSLSSSEIFAWQITE